MSKLQKAFDLLGFNEGNKAKPEGVTPQQQREGLFQYFYMAGYLSDSLIDWAVDCLVSETPFSQVNAYRDIIKDSLKQAVTISKTPDGEFDSAKFLRKIESIEVLLDEQDWMDLIVFLSQTAFNRKPGQERHQMPPAEQLAEYGEGKPFIDIARQLGMIDAKEPSESEYQGIAVMGASYFAADLRVQYLRDLLKDNPDKFKEGDYHLYACTGTRELSPGLDGQDNLQRVIDYKDTRQVGEPDMMDYLFSQYDLKAYQRAEGDVELGGSRATTATSSAQLAQQFMEDIQSSSAPSKDNFNFLIIAEKPYAHRMAETVQKNFDQKRQENRFGPTIKIDVAGPAVKNEVQVNPDQNSNSLAKIASELAIMIAERRNHAYYYQQELEPKRGASILMYNKRQKRWEDNELAQPQAQAAAQMAP